MLSLAKENSSYKTLFFNSMRTFFPAYKWQDLNNSKYEEVRISLQEPFVSLTCNERIWQEEVKDFSQEEVKWSIKRSLFRIIEEKFQLEAPPWGVLTGIRPSKIVHRMMDEALSEEDILKRLENFYLLEREKSLLLYELALRQRPFLLSKEETYKKMAIYISIPFCQSICSYCTFGSWHLEKHQQALAPYLDKLFLELEGFLPLLEKYSIEIDKIYIGGGTPSIINERQLENLLKLLQSFIDFDQLLEFSFEAGRPDSLSLEKIRLLKEYGVNRISINPQIMSDKHLKKTGRNHTVEDIKRIYNLTRQEGIEIINMDLIMGLEDRQEEFISSLREIIAMGPENITLHSLAFKRKAKLELDSSLVGSLNHGETYKKSIEILREASYLPYYLYKQKLTAGGQENIGFAKEGSFSPYNIQMIEERQTILAFGSGASSKLVYPESYKLKNVFSTKDIYAYGDKIEEINEIKRNFLEKISKEHSNGN